MKDRIPVALVAFLFLVVLPVNYVAAIAVTASDFTDGEYVYQLSTAGYSAYGNSHDALLLEENNLGNVISWYPTMLHEMYGSSASYPYFIYHWDFSASLQPVEVTISDRITLFTNNGNERVNVVFSFSLDGVSYSTFRDITTPSDELVVEDIRETYTLPLGPGVTDFYYRVEATSAPGDSNGFVDYNLTQWARTSVGAASPFVARFSAVPEPTSLALLAMGSLWLVRRRRRGQRLRA